MAFHLGPQEAFPAFPTSSEIDEQHTLLRQRLGDLAVRLRGSVQYEDAVIIEPPGYDVTGNHSEKYLAGQAGPRQLYELPDDVRIEEVRIVQPTSVAMAFVRRAIGSKFHTGEPMTDIIQTDAFNRDWTRPLAEPTHFIGTVMPRQAIVHGDETCPISPIVVEPVMRGAGRILYPTVIADRLAEGYCLADEIRSPADAENPIGDLSRLRGLFKHIQTQGRLIASQPTTPSHGSNYEEMY